MKSDIFLIKLLIVVAIFLSIPNLLNSQNRFGIYAGIGMCKEGNSLFGTGFRPGVDLNATYNITYSKHLDFRLMAGYKLRGFREDYPVNSGNSEELKKTDYHLLSLGPDVIIPLFRTKNNSSLYFSGGLRCNVLLAMTGSFKDYEIDYEDFLDKIQLEADAGIGWQFDMGLLLEAVVSGNCLNKGNKSYDEDFKAYDLYFGLGVGYVFSRRESRE
jgi:hypothetical protein